MKEEKKESPIGVLWVWGKPYHGKFIGSVILAVLGVACQMVPYFCVAHIVTMMLSGEQNFSRYVTAGIIALCGYFGKVLFSCLSTTISHTATYYTLRDLRENITAKLARVPMGTILDTPSGQYKTTIVDRVEGMESVSYTHLPISIHPLTPELKWRTSMFNKKSEYAQNKREKDSIIYISVNGRIRLTRADFSSEEEFLRWKQWSDEDYYETERQGRGYYDNGVSLDENISAAGAVESAEDTYFRELLADEIEAARKALCQERIAKVKALLTARQYRRIWMYLAEGKSITEIARDEGLSKASVSRSIAAALHKLRKLR